MDFYDFQGMTFEEAKCKLTTEYPEVSFTTTYYRSPRNGSNSNLDGNTYRIIRQKAISDLELEFTISAFRDHLE